MRRSKLVHCKAQDLDKMHQMTDENSGLRGNLSLRSEFSWRFLKKIAGAIVTSLRRRVTRGVEKLEISFGGKTEVDSGFVVTHPTSYAFNECRGGFFARHICFEQRAQ